MKMMKKWICSFALFLVFICGSSVFATGISNSNENNKYDLKSIAGYNTASISYIDLDTEEVTKSILNDLLIELRPYLKNVIGDNIEDNHVFSSKEVFSIVLGHPIEFVTSIYTYAVNSMREVFAIAEENATVIDK